jgi:hypothetical protein
MPAYSPSKESSQFDAIQSVGEMHLDVGFDQRTVATGQRAHALLPPCRLQDRGASSPGLSTAKISRNGSEAVLRMLSYELGYALKGAGKMHFTEVQRFSITQRLHLLG